AGAIVLGRDRLAGRASDHVEEAVLRRVQEHLPLTTVDLELGLNDRLRARVVPLLARNLLVVPAILAGIRIDGDDRAQEQIVAAAGASEMTHERRAVAGADEDEIELRIERDRVPRRPTAAELPPFPAPRLRGHLHRFVLEAVGRIAGDEIELPERRAVVRVVRADEAAHAEIRAAVTDHDLAVEDARRTGDRVRPFVAVERAHGPARLAGLRVERDQTTVERRDDDAVLPCR